LFIGKPADKWMKIKKLLAISVGYNQLKIKGYFDKFLISMNPLKAKN